MAKPLDNTSYDVAIVGFGPSGAVAAALLGQAGIRTLVFDRLREVYDKPRAIALDHEILRTFQQIGVVEDVLRWTEPFTPSEYYGADQQLIKRLATVAPPYPLGYTPSLVFTQPPVEQILRDRVGSMESVTVALGQEFIGLSQDNEKAVLHLRGEDGHRSAVTARYVIACDGASSPVRSAAGIELDDLEFDEPWLVVDVLVNEQGLRKLPETSVQYCEPQRPCTYVIGPKNHRRWEISLLPGEDPKAMATEQGAWSVLQRWITPEDATLWRQASYRFHALVAKDWRRGRVFIAGDAAHQQPPFLGQGMCQGIRDVANLCWKMRSVLAGESSDALLDSYGVERARHVRSLTGRIKEIGTVICERHPAAARARDTRLLAEAGGQVRTQARQDIIPPLETGLLASTAHSGRGTLFPQPRVFYNDGTALLDEVAGCGWRVVTNESPDRWSEETRAMASDLGILVCILADAAARPEADGNGVLALIEVEGVMQKWFARHECVAAIVRPDHYVYGAARNADELQAMLIAVHARVDAEAPAVP
jgi:3-(3-hydroxy-phenyl)propionate hydroxylase